MRNQRDSRLSNIKKLAYSELPYFGGYRPFHRRTWRRSTKQLLAVLNFIHSSFTVAYLLQRAREGEMMANFRKVYLWDSRVM
jgi:hypothetical protein